MSPLAENDELSYYDDDDDDDGFNADIEALRRACMLTGKDPDDITTKNDDENPSSNQNDDVDLSSAPNSDSDFDEDLELLRKIKSQFSNASLKPLSLKPLCTLLPPSASDEEEDDYQTLLAVRKRFAAYENDTQEKSAEQIDPSCKSVEETCNEVSGTDAHERFRTLVTDNEEGQPSTSIEWIQSDSCEPTMLPTKSSGFPKSALAFLDAINKNRSCQKFLRTKLIQIQAKIEENNKLKQRVKILRDFQAHCKRRTGEALSQKKDPRVQLILTKKPRADSKAHDRTISAMSYGPEENSHVANYRKASTKFPLSLDRKNWSEVEKKDLQKGIIQQFQEMVLQSSVDESSYSETPHGDSNDIDKILASIKDLEITPYSIREFLPKINWEQLASMYVPGRSGGECEARWLNWEDPLINHGPWTTDEDKMILYLVQKKNGVNDWINIAEAVGTNRTPFQCLTRYQRSLNASILKREWTKDEDAKLASAVEAFGEGNWQSVASALNGRTGTQCSNRWKKSLHPTRTRAGKWTPEEDKRLIVAQMLFGSKNWNKTAQFVPGRTQAQCRDRYVNSLEPSLRCGEWTEEEDSRLIAAIEEYGHCWSKVAACVPHRTDNMCWRRWKVLFPDEVPLLREEKRIRKTALIRNFVDREKERPALGPNDFLLQDVTSMKTLTYPRKTGRLSQVPKKIKPRRHRNNAQLCSEEEPGTSNSEVETYDGEDASKKKKKKVLKQHQRRHKDNEPTGDCEAVVPVPKKIRPRRNRNNGQIPGISNSEVRTCDGDDAPKKKKVLKHCHRKHKGTEPTEECKAIVPVSNEDDAHKEPTEMSCSDALKKKKVLKHRRRKHKGTEPTEECKAIVPVSNEDDAHKEPTALFYSDQIIGTSDEDDTVSYYLHKLKKRKLEVADLAVRDSPFYCIRDDEDLMQHESTIACNNKPGRRKLVRGQKLGLQEPMRGVLGIYPGSDHETDDPVVASTGKKNSKKRHAQTTKRHVICNDPDAGDLPKQEEVTIKSGKEQASAGADSGDDITLACFLNRLKKRRESDRGDIQIPR
ncbi:myb-like protein L [Rosa sericea]